MNMQDYRHAAERVHIAEHCEKEVLSMTTQTEQKTRKPLLRTATGIAAAAACIGITGALGFALFQMSRGNSELNAASQDGTGQTVSDTDQYPADTVPVYPFEDYAAAYYEKLAGHPVSYDWSSLYGTNLNETWELPENTVTLNAALTDGMILQFYYTVKPEWNWSNKPEYNDKLPTLSFSPAVLSGSSGMAFSDSLRTYGFHAEAVIDDALREDGTIRVCSSFMGVTPELGREFHVSFGEPGGSAGQSECDTRVITLNLPTQGQTMMLGELSVPLHAEGGQGGSAYEADYSYAIVTPLCAWLMDEISYVITDEAEADPEISAGTDPEADPDLRKIWVKTVSPAKVVQGNAEEIPVSVLDTHREIYGIQAFMLSERQGANSELKCCFLPFSEPQDLSQAEAIRFTSDAQEEPSDLLLNGGTVAVPVDPTAEKLLRDPKLDQDKAQINKSAEPETTAEQGLQNALSDKITAQLNALTWSPDICDGIPEYTWTGTDGTVYDFNLSDNWVWKKNGQTQQEAQLTEDLAALLNVYKEKYGLAESYYYHP